MTIKLPDHLSKESEKELTLTLKYREAFDIFNALYSLIEGSDYDNSLRKSLGDLTDSIHESISETCPEYIDFVSKILELTLNKVSKS